MTTIRVTCQTCGATFNADALNLLPEGCGHCGSVAVIVGSPRCACGAQLRGGCKRLGMCSACSRKAREQRLCDAFTAQAEAIEAAFAAIDAEKAGALP